MQDISWNRRRI